MNVINTKTKVINKTIGTNSSFITLLEVVTEYVEGTSDDVMQIMFAYKVKQDDVNYCAVHIQYDVSDVLDGRFQCDKSVYAGDDGISFEECHAAIGHVLKVHEELSAEYRKELKIEDDE